MNGRKKFRGRGNFFSLRKGGELKFWGGKSGLGMMQEKSQAEAKGTGGGGVIVIQGGKRR